MTWLRVGVELGPEGLRVRVRVRVGARARVRVGARARVSVRVRVGTAVRGWVRARVRVRMRDRRLGVEVPRLRSAASTAPAARRQCSAQSKRAPIWG